MLKSRLTKLMSLFLAMTMVIGMTACGAETTTTNSSKQNDSSTDSTSKQEENKPGEYTNLKFITTGAGLFEEEKSATVKKIAEETGVFVQTTVVAEDKFSVLMASGDLEADLISPRTVNQQQLIEGELIIPLDDLIEKAGPDIKKNAQKSLDYWKKYKSYGRDKIFFVPSHNAPDIKEITDSIPYNYGVAPYIRWDYYAELGYPEIKNEDDFLNVLKQMQDKHPKNADGKKTYAMSLSLGDSSLWNYFCMYSYMNNGENINWLVMRNSDYEISGNVLEPTYLGWQAVEYYNKAFRLGIYDPESFTQKRENVNQKATTGQTFYTENSWNDYNQVLGETVGKEAGFAAMIDGFPTAYAGGTSNYGWAFSTSITSSCKDPEAAMKWINYLYTPEGARLLYSGVEGVHWDYDANKVPVLKDETIKMKQDLEWNKINGLNKFANMIGIDNIVKHPDGYPVDLFQTPEMLVKSNKPVDENYSKHYGATFPGEVGKVLEEKGKTKVIWWLSDASALMPVMPDNIKRVLTKVEDAMIKAIPRMIMSKTKEEFDKVKADTIKQLDGLGAKEVVDWTTKEYNASKEKMSALK